MQLPHSAAERSRLSWFQLQPMKDNEHGGKVYGRAVRFVMAASSMPTKASRQALKVALIYVFVAGGWILFSDRMVWLLIHNPDLREEISIFKGWAFVLVTGGLLYLALRRLLRQWEREAEQRKEAEIARQEIVDRLQQSEEQLRQVLNGSAD